MTAASSRGNAWRMSHTNGDATSWLCTRASGTRSARATSPRRARSPPSWRGRTYTEGTLRERASSSPRRSTISPRCGTSDTSRRCCPAAWRVNSGPRSTARSTARARSSAKQSESSAAIATTRARRPRSAVIGARSPALSLARRGRACRGQPRTGPPHPGASRARPGAGAARDRGAGGAGVPRRAGSRRRPPAAGATPGRGRGAPARRPGARSGATAGCASPGSGDADRSRGAPADAAPTGTARAAQGRSLSDLDPLDDAELGAARARILGDLLGRRTLRPRSQDTHLAAPPAGAAWQPRRTEARGRPATKRLLHASILEGVVGDDGEPPARPEQVPAVGEEPIEGAELVVDHDAEGLEGARGRVQPGLAPAYDPGDDFCQRGGGVEPTRTHGGQ